MIVVLLIVCVLICFFGCMCCFMIKNRDLYTQRLMEQESRISEQTDRIHRMANI